MWGRFKTRRALEALDGLRPLADLDPVEAKEAEAFRDLGRLVREASAPRRDPPPFDLMWAGVEARVAAETREAEAPASGLLHRRPFLVLAPAGVAMAAVVLGALLWMGRGDAQDNRAFVDSSEAESGTVFIDQDLDDPTRATVIWHLDQEG